MGLSWQHILLLMIVALLLFGGRGKISGLMGDFASGIKAFKKGLAEDDSEKPEVPKTDDAKTIDQLQQVQDQLQSMKQILSRQQADTNRLSDQVSGLTNAIDEMLRPIASVPTPEASSPPSPRHARPRATKRQSTDTHRKPAKPRS